MVFIPPKLKEKIHLKSKLKYPHLQMYHLTNWNTFGLF